MGNSHMAEQQRSERGDHRAQGFQRRTDQRQPQHQPQRRVQYLQNLLGGVLYTLKQWENNLIDIHRNLTKDDVNVSAVKVFSLLEEMEKHLHDKLSPYRAQSRRTHGAIRSTTKDEIEHVKELTHLLEEIDLKEKEIEQLQRERTRDMTKHVEEVEELKAAKGEALNRLSELSSKQLRENNPNVTDLSDVNRPTKLAECYNELYDREWTDAFAVLTAKDKMEEDQAIVLLLATLTDVYSQCSKDVENLKSGIIGVFKKEMVDDDPLQVIEAESKLLESDKREKSHSAQTPTFYEEQYSQQKEMKSWDSAEAKQSISELAKAMAPTLVKSFEMKCVKKHRTHAKYGEELLSFVARCAHICFFMVIQTPPLVFHDRPGENNFNRDLYKPYTKTGSLVDYIVWPPLLLHKDGPLLGKGVAQGK